MISVWYHFIFHSSSDTEEHIHYIYIPFTVFGKSRCQSVQCFTVQNRIKINQSNWCFLTEYSSVNDVIGLNISIHLWSNQWKGCIEFKNKTHCMDNKSDLFSPVAKLQVKIQPSGSHGVNYIVRYDFSLTSTIFILSLKLKL